MPADAAILVRLSKDHEAATSNARQMADLLEHAQRESLNVVHRWVEVGSGYRKEVSRPMFQAAMDWTTATSGRTLLVWKLDRLSRRGMGKVGQVLDELEAVGSRLVSLKDGLDSSVPGHRMVIAILSEQARSESQNTSVRTRSALQTRRKEGRWPGGRAPYGFRIVTRALSARVAHPDGCHVDPEGEPGRLVEHPEQADVIRAIVASVLAGATLYGEADRLSDAGIPAPRGAKWRSQTLRTLLASPVLVGHLPTGKGSTVAARGPDGRPLIVGPALISSADRRRLLAALSAGSKSTGSGRRTGTGRPPSHLLTGVLRCSECRSAMSGGGSGSNQRYACSLSQSGGQCGGNTVSLRSADAYVTDRLLRRWAAMEPHDPVLNEVAAVLLGRPLVDPLGAADRATLENELADLQGQLDEVAAIRLDPEFRGPDGAARYARLRDPVLASIAEHEAALRAARSAEPNLGALLDPTELRELWEGVPVAARRAALVASVESLEAVKASGHANRFDGDARLRLVWSSRPDADAA
ncbi:MAG: recombinase family protein [Acidimicrobiia bacterium]